MGKRILVISHTDHHELGHGWSLAKQFESLGFETQIIFFIKRLNPDTQNYIIDYHKPFSPKYVLYAIIRFLNWLTFPGKSGKSWFRGLVYPAHRDILRRIKRRPDIIVIGSFVRFLSPKAIRDLYEKTHAMIVFCPPDEQMLTGGCRYPHECALYKQGCAGCQKTPYMRWIPERVLKQRETFLKDVPFHFVGSNFGLRQAQNVTYMKGKPFHIAVTVPDVPLVKSKYDARLRLGIEDEEFLILAGAANLDNDRKGIPELLDSLHLLADRINSNHPVTVLLIGNKEDGIATDSRLKFICPGYLGLEDLFTAFYACDVFASSSLYDSGPMMVNYAIACGRPVVAFPVGVAPDLVLHRQTGWMAPFRDTGSFADGLEFFYHCTAKELAVFQDNCLTRMKFFEERPWYMFMLEEQNTLNDTFQ